ncbi:hypothetical protein [Burkholderia lata]|uniref:hypothetical protein n=1 Tax=Burkholderia lata (strain ATCC 17760 / DSM 23089 / LMG 22485 / NCIMB 9086 / R18194 / 383) TaxID=482957 RepID=UPI0015815C9E|nr:hypothetical protein [Burkholderia lata]
MVVFFGTIFTNARQADAFCPTLQTLSSGSFDRLSDDRRLAIRAASRRIFSSLRAHHDQQKQRCVRDLPVIAIARDVPIGLPITRENPETSLQRFT